MPFTPLEAETRGARALVEQARRYRMHPDILNRRLRILAALERGQVQQAQEITRERYQR